MEDPAQTVREGTVMEIVGLRGEKVGYTREGVFRKRVWIEGQWHDTIRYAILDEDYFAGR
jgi:hypothetical protein